MIVYLVTHGDGEDGNEWFLHGIFSTRGLAEAFKAKQPRNESLEIEEWPVDEDKA